MGIWFLTTISFIFHSTGKMLQACSCALSLCQNRPRRKYSIIIISLEFLRIHMYSFFTMFLGACFLLRISGVFFSLNSIKVIFFLHQYKFVCIAYWLLCSLKNSSWQKGSFPFYISLSIPCWQYMVNVQFKLSSEDLTKLWSYSPSYDLIDFFITCPNLFYSTQILNNRSPLLFFFFF